VATRYETIVSIRALLGVLAVVTACHRTSPSPRERVLARLAADSELVLVADGSALATPESRAVLDVLRPQWPATLGCVIDAAQTGEQIAIGIAANEATTIVLSTHGAVRCPALSRVDDLWIATLGGGTPATGPSVLDAEAFARSRPYLVSAPIAISSVVPGGKLLATASPRPLEAWVALDALPDDARQVEQLVRGYVARLAGTASTAPFAANIRVTREGPQIVARLEGHVDADLAVAVRTVLGWKDAATVRDDAFVCPGVLTPPVVSCQGGRWFVVTALRTAVTAVIDAEVTPVVVNGSVTGLRLAAAVPSLGLVAGDVVVGADGRHVTGRSQLAEILRGTSVSTTLTVQRAGTATELRIVER
jgi:hypothetical protein